MQDLEQANDSQLYEILQELKKTPFFRNFVVDLQHKCPLASWNHDHGSSSHPKHGNQKTLPTPSSSTSTSTTTSHTKSPFQEKTPFSTTSSASPPTTATTATITATTSSTDSDFECSGGDVGADLDDDAEPLCTVQPMMPPDEPGPSGSNSRSRNHPFPFTSSSSSSWYDSNALHHLESTGFQSQAQKDTFAWKDVTDVVFTEVEATKKVHNRISEDELLPDTFWKDMCSSIGLGDGTATTVNLALNPERNTGYNGTHIWKAIYEENCIVDLKIAKAAAAVARAASDDGDDGAPQSDTHFMCLEERVLYRLLSGLHTSTTVSIAMNYYPPSKKKGRTTWEANPVYFMEKFQSHPDHIRNLHFSYVVLLRALSKTSPFLYQYSGIQTGNEADDATTLKLLRRLLDSSILQSCSSVFTAFDESKMFQEDLNQSNANNQRAINVVALKQNFKGIFHNVSSILDCVQCQQCKLHGKLVMLGYGVALKVLFMPAPPALERNEIVALVDTLIKLSESIRHVRELTTLYWNQQQQQDQQQQQRVERKDQTTTTPAVTMTPPSVTALPPPTTVTASPPSTTASSLLTAQVSPTPRVTGADAIGAAITTTSSLSSLELVDAAVGVVAELGRRGRLSSEREEELVRWALQRHSELLILVKHYGGNLDKFLALSRNIVGSSTDVTASPAATTNTKSGQARTATVAADARIQSLWSDSPDAIVVGSGLAGMAATLNLLDRGGRVIVIEKEHLLGGNSNKASSGINAYCPPADGNSTGTHDDSLEIFWNDTFRSAGSSARKDLITTLVSKSGEAVDWLRTRVGVDLSLISQLGGHSTKRTHRPSNGMAGAEIIYGMQKAVKAYVKTGEVTIMTDTKVTKLLTDRDGSVIGVECVSTHDKDAVPFELHAPNVVLATGGFASDRSHGSYLEKYRPELLKMPTTAGAFSTGDGITLATQLGAATVDMDKVQVHPTGWVDPSDPDNTSKVLAAELMRGVGGLLLNDAGKRFCNELGTRSYVTNKMLEHDADFAKTGNWSLDARIPTFSLVLSSSAAADGKKHVDLYSHKGLLTRLEGVTALAQWMGLPKKTVVSTLQEYQKNAESGSDKFGKTTFRGVPAKDLESEVFYAGKVIPVLHYCMGGITIDVEGNVLNNEGVIIPGLHAAGEVSGGVHGVNRLAGNSLLECTVYGTIVGKKLPVHKASQTQPTVQDDETAKSPTKLRNVPKSELQQHGKPDDCWIAIHGFVYDLTDFAEEHPAGAQSIHELAGKDGTEAFAAVHNDRMLEEFDEEIVGVYVG